MHELQPKHSKLKKEDVAKLLSKYNISLSQLPRVSREDPALPEGCITGDVVKIERKIENGAEEFFRVVV